MKSFFENIFCCNTHFLKDKEKNNDLLFYSVKF